MEIEELKIRADKILALAATMDEAFGTNPGEHLVLAIMAGLQDASHQITKTFATQIKEECAHQGIGLFNTHKEMPNHLYFNGLQFQTPQMVYVNEKKHEIICPAGRNMPWNAQKTTKIIKYCAGGSTKNPCAGCLCREKPYEDIGRGPQ